MAGGPRLELGMSESKSDVLPITPTAIDKEVRRGIGVSPTNLLT